MKEYTLPDATKITEGIPFSSVATVETVNDDGESITVEDELKFGADWLQYATPEDLERMGITVEEVPGPATPKPGEDIPTPVTQTSLLIDAMYEEGIIDAEQREALHKAILVG